MGTKMINWEKTVMTKEQQAIVWLKTEQGAGFLRDCDIKGILADPNLFGEEEQLHSQANALAQAEISFKAGMLAERERILRVGDYSNGNVAKDEGRVRARELLEKLARER